MNEAFNLSREPMIEYTIPDSETDSKLGPGIFLTCKKIPGPNLPRTCFYDNMIINIRYEILDIKRFNRMKI